MVKLVERDEGSRSSFELAQPRAQDVPRLLELNEAAVPEVNSVSSAQMQWFLDRCSEDQGLARVAIVDGKIGGLFVGLLPGTGYQSLNYRWFEARRNDFAYIDRVIVDPDFRRRGIAQGFYRAFESWSRGRATRLTCEVNLRPPNPGSMAFHRAMGFAEVGRQETEGGAKEVCMLARLL